MQFIHFCKSSPIETPTDLSEYSAIVACVGVGNVSQLACDLLIFNLKCELVAHLDFKYVLSVVGRNPYLESDFDLMTSCQLYVNRKLHLAVIQFRASACSNTKRKHIEELVASLRLLNFKHLILLSSSFATVRNDAELDASKLSFSFSPSFDKCLAERLNLLKWLPLSCAGKEIEEDVLTERLASKTLFHLPGSGIASRLFDGLVSSDVPFSVCLVNHFTSEGDNSGDAFYIVGQLDDWLQFSSKLGKSLQWLPPMSWNMLFGSEARRSLY